MNETQPRIRTRINHSHTLKDGWRLSDTTVEWDGEGEPDWDTIKNIMRRAFAEGVNEADLRNQGGS